MPVIGSEPPVVEISIGCPRTTSASDVASISVHLNAVVAVEAPPSATQHHALLSLEIETVADDLTVRRWSANEERENVLEGQEQG